MADEENRTYGKEELNQILKRQEIYLKTPEELLAEHPELASENFEKNHYEAFDNIHKESLKDLQNFVDGSLVIAPDGLERMEDFIATFADGYKAPEIKELAAAARKKLGELKETAARQNDSPEKNEKRAEDEDRSFDAFLNDMGVKKEDFDKYEDGSKEMWSVGYRNWLEKKEQETAKTDENPEHPLNEKQLDSLRGFSGQEYADNLTWEQLGQGEQDFLNQLGQGYKPEKPTAEKAEDDKSFEAFLLSQGIDKNRLVEDDPRFMQQLKNRYNIWKGEKPLTPEQLAEIARKEALRKKARKTVGIDDIENNTGIDRLDEKLKKQNQSQEAPVIIELGQENIEDDNQNIVDNGKTQPKEKITIAANADNNTPKKESFWKRLGNKVRKWKKYLIGAAVVVGGFLLLNKSCEKENKDDNTKRITPVNVIPVPENPGLNNQDQIPDINIPTPQDKAKDIEMLREIARRLGHQEKLSTEEAIKLAQSNLDKFSKLPDELKAKFSGERDSEKLAKMTVVRGDQNALRETCDKIVNGEEVSVKDRMEVSRRTKRVTSDFGADVTYKDPTVGRQVGKQTITVTPQDIAKALKNNQQH